VRTLQDYVTAFGPEAGPKLFHTLRSRAAYKGVSTRRRHQIEAMTGRPFRTRRRLAAKRVQAQGVLPLADLAPAEPSALG
jgi:hypothetical protein